MKAVVFRGHNGGWYVRIVAANGEPMLVSEGYVSKWNAKRAAKKWGIPVEVEEADGSRTTEEA